MLQRVLKDAKCLLCDFRGGIASRYPPSCFRAWDDSVATSTSLCINHILLRYSRPTDRTGANYTVVSSNLSLVDTRFVLQVLHYSPRSRRNRWHHSGQTLAYTNHLAQLHSRRRIGWVGRWTNMSSSMGTLQDYSTSRYYRMTQMPNARHNALRQYHQTPQP